MTASGRTAAEPIDLDALRDALRRAPDAEHLRPIGLRHVHLGTDALDELPAVVAGVRRPGDVVLLMDATPMRRGDDDLKALVRTRLAARLPVRVVVLDAPGGLVHADEATVAVAHREAAGAGCLVTVGSGTITDIGKDVSAGDGDLPLVVVQTAVSVNGYADDMAVLLRDGVKRTVASRWPDALVADTGVLAAAPPAMNRAGAGELLAMFTAPADWYLADALGMAEGYSASVVALYRRHGEAVLALAPLVGAGDPAALEELARVMTLSGVAMGVAGGTAPLSGMEHTVSHLLDMDAGARGRPTALHGAQVGVAAVVASLLWTRVRRGFDPQRLRDDGAFPEPATLRSRVTAAFDHLDPSGTMAAECWRDYERKLRRWHAGRGRVAAVAADWPAHEEVLDTLLMPPAALAAALQRAHAPARFSDLDPPPDPDTVRWALANCHLMRDRFGVADLAFLLGRWEAGDVADVLAEAATLGAGL
ncbi:MAG TPA: iron-containing alcohol dehydrogenase [Euzebyales bacterium]|nr:iron-containing alcohol dehydrogenase [Euzebyales bacterium]